MTTNSVACTNDNNATACGIAAYISIKSFKNYKLAFEYAKKGCDSKDSYSCHVVSYLYYSGKSVRQNYKKACDLSDAESCVAIGMLY